jgi:hypothetical protein
MRDWTDVGSWPCSSPKVRISTPSTVRRSDRPRRLPCFAAKGGAGANWTRANGQRSFRTNRSLAPASAVFGSASKQPPASRPARCPFRTPAATRSRWSIRLLIRGRRCRCLPDAGSCELPPTGAWMASSLEVGLLISREAAAGRGGECRPARKASLLAQSSSPALTCIIGARLAWIALMISSVLIPWRYTLVVDTYECPSWRWITGSGTPSRASSTA